MDSLIVGLVDEGGVEGWRGSGICLGPAGRWMCMVVKRGEGSRGSCLLVERIEVVGGWVAGVLRPRIWSGLDLARV